jgi:NAD(P)-dependent dehydrogenase (short-subunit alcohol dehydrogenase family)
MPGRLEGRLALVTGASRGIGAATAEALASEGAHVILTARTAAGLEEVESRIHDAGGSATIAPLDLTEGDSIAKLGTAFVQRWQALDIMILNAAMLGPLTPASQIDSGEFNRVLTLNLLAQQNMIANFDQMLRNSGRGRLIVLTASVGQNPRPFWAAYGASKAALENLVLSYGEEIRRLSSVKVAIVDPGATATAMRARAFPGEDPSTLKSPAVVADAIVTLLTGDFETGQRIRVEG